METAPVLIRFADSQDDELIASHFYQMWRDNGVTAAQLRSDWLAVTLEFIHQARQTLHYQAFVAEVEGAIAGSVGCQLFAGLYPQVLTDSYRKYGYLWGVYVEPAYRRQGIGRALTQRAIAYLQAIDCTRVILHASPSGQPVYTQLGFVGTNEMRLDLISTTPC